MTAEPRQHAEIVAARMRDEAGAGIAGEVETGHRRLGKTGAVERARGVAEMVVVKLDLRAVPELVSKILGEALRVIRVGLQRRADPVDVAHGDTGLLQAESDGAARQLAARVLGQRETLLLGGRDQLAVAQQDGRAVVMAVLDAGADPNRVHAHIPSKNRLLQQPEAK